VNGLYFGHYADPKVLYTRLFDQIPWISFIGDLDISKTHDFIDNQFQNQLINVYQHNFFDHEKQELFFNNTLFVLKEKRMIELGNNYCHVLYPIRQHQWAFKLIQELAAFKVVENDNKVIGFARNNTMN
jgi:hypothetical protein